MRKIAKSARRVSESTKIEVSDPRKCMQNRCQNGHARGGIFLLIFELTLSLNLSQIDAKSKPHGHRISICF